MSSEQATDESLAVTASTDNAVPLHTTPLNDLHVSLGARMVPFAGYSMPVQYPLGVLGEHLHTRQKAGLFDVSHMGQLRLVGPQSAAAFESLMPVDVVDLTEDQMKTSRKMVKRH